MTTRSERPTARPGRRRLQGLLPHTWQGDGREARWRRSRARRVLAGLFAGAAALAVVGALRPTGPATHPVAVAAHNLPAGSRLTTGDVREVRWTAADRVPAALPASSVAGTVLTAPIAAGEPFTRTRVRAVRGWTGQQPGQVIVGVTSGDGPLMRVLRPGDRVDLIDTGKGTTIAAGVTIVSMLAPSVATHTRSVAGDAAAEGTPSALVAVSPRQAAAIGSAGAARSGGLGGGIQLALRAQD
ncbi:SAF domain-containing protein [Flexivirga caeni]|uniref:SAF domain-containing protein n=1 Tax=Flexivirga caeni TaxID=2294115 RepID=A0A3M9ME88_9MICO|nr:SAF domain-containing protein [Flexivirga caeni]RNI23881.1 hypothetical protein EFY87_06325 [Flexivirga caeni]